MRRLFMAVIILGVLAAAGFFILTMPRTLDAAVLPEHTPDLANGKKMFHAGGCASCHAPPAGDKCDDHKYDDELNLAGGRCLNTPFGTFNVPNISSDPDDGIGGWSNIQFVNAMVRGVAPDGAHYYPAFPYTSYQRMSYADLLDLKAFMDTLPAVKSQVAGHDLALPFRLRRGLGLWKLLYLDGEGFTAPAGADAKLARGAYLVQGPGHCGECHTPRDLFGGTKADARYAGSPAPEGKGFIPNITPHKTGIGDWSEADIVESLTTGFTPSFDSFGGSMVAVQENMAKLPESDREAIAVYLKSVPAVASQRPAGGN